MDSRIFNPVSHSGKTLTDSRSKRPGFAFQHTWPGFFECEILWRNQATSGFKDLARTLSAGGFYRSSPGISFPFIDEFFASQELALA